ncbi:MAG: MFS transporter [Candidatus Helarchaeota archaeon]
MTEEIRYPFYVRFSYTMGQFADIVAYQGFTYLIFAFYFAHLKLNQTWITIAFIIWAIWNALNDPLMGLISDRTKTRWGRRKPWIMIAAIPLGLIMLFLFTPPHLTATSDVLNYAYFLFIIILFEGIYTMMSLNMTSLFPEMFIDEKSRASVNRLRQIMTVIGLITATMIPTFLITDLVNKDNNPPSVGVPQFQVVGAILGGLVITGLLIALKWGVHEKKEFRQDAYNTPNVLNAFKYTLKNKSFITYVIAGLMSWYIYGMLLPIVPFYGAFVLGIDSGSLLLGVLLLLVFLMAIPGFWIWKRIGHKFGLRKGFMLSMAVWIVTLAPLYFISDVVAGLIVFAFIGLGVSGSLYYIDLIVSDIIDEDEIKTGCRREGGYYGINALIIRLSTILTFITIGLVFSTTGWWVFEPSGPIEPVIFGLRNIMFIFPVIALTIGIIAMYFYPLHGTRLVAVKEAQKKLHAEKRAAVK